MVGQLQREFGQNACPANLPMWDDGIDPTPHKIAFTDLLIAVAKNSDTVMLGDTNHFNPDLRGILKNPQNLEAIKDSGFTHIKLEVPRGMQRWVDRYNDGAITRPEFEEGIHRGLSATQGNQDGKWTRQIGAMAEFAKDNKIKLVFSDPLNGDGICEPSLDNEEQEKCELENGKDRFRDTELSIAHANDLNASSDTKILQLYGRGHFSVDYSGKEAIPGRTTKIDMYQNRSQYELDKQEDQMPNSDANKLQLGKVKPEAVYMIDEEQVYLTCATPQSLRQELEKNDEKKPQLSLPQSQVSPPTYSAPSSASSSVP